MPAFSMDDFRAQREKLRGLKGREAKKIARGREGGRRESWPAFVDRTTDAARNHIAMLMRHDAAVRLPDPRDRSQNITVGQLRDRYRELVTWLEAIR